MNTKRTKLKYGRSANQKRKIKSALIIVLLLGLLVLGVSAYFILNRGGFSPWAPGVGETKDYSRLCI